MAYLQFHDLPCLYRRRKSFDTTLKGKGRVQIRQAEI